MKKCKVVLQLSQWHVMFRCIYLPSSPLKIHHFAKHESSVAFLPLLVHIFSQVSSEKRTFLSTKIWLKQFNMLAAKKEMKES